MKSALLGYLDDLVMDAREQTPPEPGGTRLKQIDQLAVRVRRQHDMRAKAEAAAAKARSDITRAQARVARLEARLAEAAIAAELAAADGGGRVDKARATVAEVRALLVNARRWLARLQPLPAQYAAKALEHEKAASEAQTLLDAKKSQIEAEATAAAGLERSRKVGHEGQPPEQGARQPPRETQKEEKKGRRPGRGRKADAQQFVVTSPLLKDDAHSIGAVGGRGEELLRLNGLPQIDGVGNTNELSAGSVFLPDERSLGAAWLAEAQRRVRASAAALPNALRDVIVAGVASARQPLPSALRSVIPARSLVHFH
jgi:hypothetical protein